ncbi:GAF and ANTAR domain-containing protein [Rhodococcus fascians]|nr:GAF and ANTAR domain-containing protein [Rhodococcus fascians]MBY4056696.1 GAF and ANTAR domain-containing protein [Rhodococcus fascians]MBY4068079.1 GAF and ANTAR domain-containing protein [Rhodococcus fascians]MBY4228595.1 GAF and ANTAR domain-containing protein [Rhodococcus fascians]MBY4401611.1 GAF and ANTAR domain-containing protein [Rhodococcus fascians]
MHDDDPALSGANRERPYAVNPDDDGEDGRDRSDRDSLVVSPQLMLHRTCDAVTVGARVDGLAVALMSASGARELVYASSALAQYLDDIQFTSGVGPCLDAFTSEQPVLCPVLNEPAVRERWLGFTEDAVEAGAAGVFAFPLISGTTVFGSLELYRTSTGNLSESEHESAVRGAATIAHLLLTHFAASQQGVAEDDVSARSQNTVFDSEFSRPQVNHAAGMVSVQLDVSIDDAMATMRSRAYLEHRSLADIADDVLARRLVFDESDFDARRDDGGGT